MGNTTTGAVNGALYFIGVFSFLIFFALIFVMVYFAVRYRKSRNPVATEIPGSPWLEVLWIALPTLLAVAMFMYGLTGYNFLRHPPAGAMEVTVHSKQWAWSFEYADGRIVPDLVVPSGRDVRLTLTSDDVLHGFYVPDYRIQVDTVPGMKTLAWLKAGAPGTSDILCTVYCGTAHSNMIAKLVVLPPATYEDWYAGKEVELGLEPAAGAHGMAGMEEESGSVLALLRAKGCVNCHSVDGSRGAAPSLKGLGGQEVELVAGGKTRKLVIDASYLRRAILEPGAELVKGWPDIMPKGEFSEDELDSVVAWIEGLR